MGSVAASIKARAVGDRHDRRGRDDQQLLLGSALGAARVGHGHHLFADAQPVHARSDRLDHAGRVHPGHPRRLARAAALAQADVGRVDGRGLDRDPYLALAGLASGEVGDFEDVEVARLGDDDGAQGSDLLL